ncbi:mitochondrial carrier domain-containing protein [Kickxella alabastrina]|uniref:mitochondrial carrier domain-containing protein n=1 Tax=Kickxella alabastrina TaxID=61397 RepID=UPI00221EA352|nr:mitochondrial carrier domain-containing protein [Kickxella alabastrina]KAI7833653.1 mitochondrial carrier domain-containing protein [Kickxella alabastrina]
METVIITTKKKEVVPKAAGEFVAGTMGGWAQVVVGHPFDTIKVRMQTQPNPPVYSGGMDCLRATIKGEGMAGLYKGVTSPLAGIGFCNAVVFAANGYFLRLLQSNSSGPLTLNQKAMAGGLAGGVMSFLNCPVELLKVKLQTQSAIAAVAGHKPYTGVFNCGLLGLFWMYEGLKAALVYRRLGVADGSKSNGAEQFLAGGFAGIAAWLTAYPQDVIKSRMQMDYKYKTTSDAFKALLHESKGGNWRIFFRGFGPTILRAFPANAATFVMYEWTMKALSS